jgi:hypothetical protein
MSSAWLSVESPPCLFQRYVFSDLKPAFIIPEGSTKIAQPFKAGCDAEKESSPEEGRQKAQAVVRRAILASPNVGLQWDNSQKQISAVPDGTCGVCGPAPSLKRLGYFQVVPPGHGAKHIPPAEERERSGLNCTTPKDFAMKNCLAVFLGTHLDTATGARDVRRRAGDSASPMVVLSRCAVFLVFCAFSLFAQPTALYENNFQKAEVGKVPEDIMVLEGGFAVRQEGDNKYLELPGAPLDSFAVLFGPTESSNVVVAASVNAVSKGRRFPTFGVGLNGVAGYRLQVAPGKKLLELYKDQEVKASVPYEWKSGEWSVCRLQVRFLKAGEWRVEGKVSAEGAPEPAGWLISFEEKEEPIAGRASLFGSPFSGEPIKYDDLVVRPIAKP